MHDPMDEIMRASAQVRAARARVRPSLLRVHPLDLAAIPRSRGVPFGGMDITRLVGIPVEPDCAVPRGEPVVECAFE